MRIEVLSPINEECPDCANKMVSNGHANYCGRCGYNEFTAAYRKRYSSIVVKKLITDPTQLC